VFTSHLGVALDAANARKMFKRACKVAGVGGGWAPCELRTSFVSLASHHGVSIEEIARMVGRSARTTEVVYRRELRPVITTVAEIMDEILAGAPCVSVVDGAWRVITMPRPGWRAASGMLKSSVAALGPLHGELGRGQ